MLVHAEHACYIISKYIPIEIRHAKIRISQVAIFGTANSSSKTTATSTTTNEIGSIFSWTFQDDNVLSTEV